MTEDHMRDLETQLAEAQRLAEEWQTAFDTLSDAVWILDSDLSVIRSNSAAGALLGKKSEELCGRHCWEIVHGTSGPIPECPLQRSRQHPPEDQLFGQPREQHGEEEASPADGIAEEPAKRGHLLA